MTLYRGGCHCGLVSVVFQTAIHPSQLGLRRCSCRFCRLHGAVTATDPAGRLSFIGEPKGYRFGLATANFLLCPRCGVYLGAILTDQDRQFATLNLNTLERAAEFSQPPITVEYAEEEREKRIARRVRNWTPARIESSMS